MYRIYRKRTVGAGLALPCAAADGVNQSRVAAGFKPADIVLVLVTLFLLGGCSKHEPPKTAEALTGTFPTSKARNTVTIFSTGGIRTTEIFSDSVVNFAEKDSTLAYGLKVNFYDNIGNWSSLLVADSGVIREHTEDLEVFGQVNVTTRDSVRVETSQLAWNPKTAKIISDSLVTITKHGDIIRGWGMESDPDLKHLTLKKRVTGRIENYKQTVDSM